MGTKSYYVILIFATFVLIMMAPCIVSGLSWGETKPGSIKTSPSMLFPRDGTGSHEGSLYKSLEGTNSCIEKCKIEPDIQKTTDPTKEDCILKCIDESNYQNYGCDECKANCEGLRIDLVPICKQQCNDYLLKCMDPKVNCAACLYQCIKNENDKNGCFSLCALEPPNNTNPDLFPPCNPEQMTDYECMKNEPSFLLKDVKISNDWKKHCCEFGCEVPPYPDCGKCLDVCKDLDKLSPDLQQDCVWKCEGIENCKAINKESCSKCFSNCEGLLPSVRKYCEENCKAENKNCVLPDPSKCDDCWNSCKSKPDVASQSACVMECQKGSSFDCKYSTCNECLDRAVGLMPGVYDYWIQKCREDYPYCGSKSPTQCDKCWSDCTTKYSTKSDINSLNSCIDTCQKTDSCVESTCGQCQLRTNNAISAGKLPQEWKETMEKKCFSWYPDCVAAGSDCYICGQDCEGNVDCMNNKCKDCVPGWGEYNCIGCEEFCSKQFNPSYCENVCEQKVNADKCPKRDCTSCLDKCNILPDTEQKQICDTLCLMNKNNNCKTECSDCWNECSHIVDSYTRWNCQKGCESKDSSICNPEYTASCKSCLLNCKNSMVGAGVVVSYGMAQDLNIYCGSICSNFHAGCISNKPASFSLSGNSSLANLTPTLPVIAISNLTTRGRETVPVTWIAITSRPATWAPVITPFEPGTGSIKGGTWTGTTSSWLPSSIQTNLASNPSNGRSVTGAENPVNDKPLFYSSTGTGNKSLNETQKRNMT